jgi:hypothetical protein
MPAREEIHLTTTPRKPRKAKLPAILVWCRAIGLFSVFAGGLGLTQPQFFWLAVALVYGGLLLLIADVYFEPNLPRAFKAVVVSVVIVGLLAFSRLIVFVPAPLALSSLSTDNYYGDGSGPGGIAWRSVFTELVLTVNNPTGRGYGDVDLWVRPDYPVAAIAQLSNLSDVSFEDYYGVTDRIRIEDLSTREGVPMVFLATDAGYKVHCGDIPPHSSLQIVMAVVDTKKSQPQDPKNPVVVPGNASLDDFIVEQTIRTKGGDKAVYWFGSAKHRSFYVPGAKPKKVAVSGSYTATNRNRSASQEVAVFGGTLN